MNSLCVCVCVCGCVCGFVFVQVRMRARQDKSQLHFSLVEHANRRIRHSLVPRWHFDMLSDDQRNNEYQKAIEAAVAKLRDSGKKVLPAPTLGPPGALSVLNPPSRKESQPHSSQNSRTHHEYVTDYPARCCQTIHHLLNPIGQVNASVYLPVRTKPAMPYMGAQGEEGGGGEGARGHPQRQYPSGRTSARSTPEPEPASCPS